MLGIRELARSVRMRTTLVSGLVVGLALALASVATVAFLERSLTSNVRDAADARASSIAGAITAGGEPSLEEAEADEGFVQVLDADGAVVASSASVEGMSMLASPETGEAVRVETTAAADEGPFLVVSAEVAGPRGQTRVVVGRSLEDVAEAVAALVPLLAVGVPSLMLVVGAVTWVLTGRALAPVEAIRTEVESISSGDLERRVPEPGTGDEVDRLAETMNRMLSRLDRSQARQRRFVADAAHELRSPVAAIRQHAEVAISHPDTTTLRELAAVVHDENRRVEDLVGDLLLLARLDESERRSAAEPVELGELVAAEAARVVAGSGARVVTDDVRTVVVEGNPSELRRAIGNLVDNAARHARSAVVVSCRPTRRGALITVDDDGPGIPDADRDRIFERFVRLDGARSRDDGGAGLGLAISRSIAEAHGGGLSVTDAPAGGARFQLEVPVD